MRALGLGRARQRSSFVTRAGEEVVATRDLSVGYAGISVAHGIDIHVRSGEVVALLGRNGAGKTTILHTIAGLLPAISGSVELHGSIPARSFHRRVRAGLALVTEERAIVRRLTVMENLKLCSGEPEASFEIFPELRALRNRRAGLLSGGEQQMLALGKLLMGRPSVLLIDELSLGLAPVVVERLLQAVQTAADQGAGVLLVEQQATTALTVADRAYVLSRGELRLSAAGKDLIERIGEIEGMYLAG